MNAIKEIATALKVTNFDIWLMQCGADPEASEREIAFSLWTHYAMMGGISQEHRLQLAAIAGIGA